MSSAHERLTPKLPLRRGGGGVVNSLPTCILNLGIGWNLSILFPFFVSKRTPFKRDQMQEILYGYQINPTTWAYLSSLMLIGIYFKFHRFWSVRNLDLAALICFSPGLLLVYNGMAGKPVLVELGYAWLFAVCGFFLIRLLLDPIMVRRPLLEPNLSLSGLTFTGVSLLVFMIANVINSPPERLENVIAKQTPVAAQPNPGFPPFHSLSSFSSKAAPSSELQVASARTAAILGHLAIVICLVLVGYRHFDSIQTGVAAATLYLLFFYTSQMTGFVDHVVPGALLVGAVVVYRLPILSGLFLGFAAGMIYYPLFLLPLWCGFYWRRGMVRFVIGALIALGIMVAALALIYPSVDELSPMLKLMFGLRNPREVLPVGFWQFHEQAFRYTVLAAFVALCGSLALWPPQKNLATLLSCSAAVMVAAQFWHANQGGLYIAWFAPLLILTIFRPNLEDRVAITAVRDARWNWRRKKG